MMNKVVQRLRPGGPACGRGPVEHWRAMPVLKANLTRNVIKYTEKRAAVVRGKRAGTVSHDGGRTTKGPALTRRCRGVAATWVHKKPELFKKDQGCVTVENGGHPEDVIRSLL